MFLRKLKGLSYPKTTTLKREIIRIGTEMMLSMSFFIIITGGDQVASKIKKNAPRMIGLGPAILQAPIETPETGVEWVN